MARSCLLTSIESILVVCADQIGNLYARPPLIRVFKQVDVGAFVESVMRRFCGFGAIEIMNIAESCQRKILLESI